MEEININGVDYKVLKKYPNFYLCVDNNGFRTCFDDFDMGIIKRRTRAEKKALGDKLIGLDTKIL